MAISDSASFDFLNDERLQKIYRDPSNPLRMKFYIEGMKCSKCVAKVEGVARKFREIDSVSVDLGQHLATVEVCDARSGFSKMARSVQELGFKVTAIPWNEIGSEEWKKESRDQLLRIGISGFLAANIMMFAFATYFGDTQELRPLFQGLQLALYLPVVTYVAWPFYKGFYQGLKDRQLTIDGPMAVASLAGFLVSCFNLSQGRENIYFDSLSGFLFLILVTRYWQKSTRHKYLKYLKPSALLDTLKARKLRAGQAIQNWDWIPTSHLESQSQILVHQGEFIPCDGFLVAYPGKAAIEVDLSLLNGESQPVPLSAPAPLRAGMRLLSDSAVVSVSATGEKTTLGQILGSIRSDSLSQLESIRSADKASQWLLIAVFSIGALLLGYGFWSHQFLDYFERAFALIVLACPCAMAFGTPLVFSFSMKKAHDLGLVVKSLTFFEKLTRIDSVFLDKTGTLTESDWILSDESFANGKEGKASFYREVVLALEAGSRHPIASALRKIFQDSLLGASRRVVDGGVETAGVGVAGRLEGVFYEFKSFQKSRHGHVIEPGVSLHKYFGLFCEGQCVWSFRLQPKLQPNSRELIEFFRQKAVPVYLLSGDLKSEVLEMGEFLGLSEDQCLYEVTPEGKMVAVKSKPRALMLGDGFNDSLALKSSYVSIAAFGGVDVALKSSDAFFVEGGFDKVSEIFRLAHRAKKQIQMNIQFALVYNVIGGILAILGYVNPFVAALLMPISSSLILLGTWWGLR